MENLTNMICRFIEIGDGSEDNIEIAVEEANDWDQVSFIYQNSIQFQIFVPKRSSLRGYIIFASPKYVVPKELIFNATLVLNTFNDWVTGINSGIQKHDGLIWFKCARFSHVEISEKEFESDLRRVLNYCWVNMPNLIDKILNGVVRIMDFSE